MLRTPERERPRDRRERRCASQSGRGGRCPSMNAIVDAIESLAEDPGEAAKVRAVLQGAARRWAAP